MGSLQTAADQDIDMTMNLPKDCLVCELRAQARPLLSVWLFDMQCQGDAVETEFVSHDY